MALIKCKECGKDMSDKAAKCPGCGAPPPKETSRVTILIGGLFALGVAFAVANGQSDPSKPAPAPKAAPTAAEVQREKDFQAVVAGAVWLKQNTKNPASFELVTAGMIDGKTACYVYRGTNSFNALVVNHHVIGQNINSGSSAAWNKYCAGKSGTDFSNAREAL